MEQLVGGFDLNHKRVKIYVAIFVFIIIIFFAVAIDNRISTATYEFHIDKLPKNHAGIKIIQISDLHNTIHGNQQDALVQKIVEAKPDLIFITGDLVDEKTKFDGTELLLKNIKNIAPIYYCIGNHEFYAKDFFETNKKIKQYGVICLEDESVVVAVNGINLLIAGLDDPKYYRKKEYKGDTATRLEKISQTSDFSGLKILLSHRPELVTLYEKYDYDFIFSGHAHGGQVIIPHVLNGLLAPNQGFFPKYAGGLYRLKNDSNLIVSRGLSINITQPRIFNPPELVVVNILPK